MGRATHVERFSRGVFELWNELEVGYRKGERGFRKEALSPYSAFRLPRSNLYILLSRFGLRPDDHIDPPVNRPSLSSLIRRQWAFGSIANGNNFFLW